MPEEYVSEGVLDGGVAGEAVGHGLRGREEMDCEWA